LLFGWSIAMGLGRTIDCFDFCCAEKDPLLAERVRRLQAIPSVGRITEPAITTGLDGREEDLGPTEGSKQYGQHPGGWRFPESEFRKTSHLKTRERLPVPFHRTWAMIGADFSDGQFPLSVRKIGTVPPHGF
jgi:hypothetical protein